MRQKVSFTLRGSSGLPRIEAQVQPGTIFEVNRYNGNWPSIVALEDYINDLVYGPGGLSESSFDPIDICEVPGIRPTVGGDSPRINPNTDTWASFQTRDVLWAAISSDSGEVRIDDELVWKAPVIDPTTLYCTVAQDDELEARVCSIVDEVEGVDNEKVDCSPEFGGDGPTVPRALGRIDEIKVNGIGTVYEVDPATGLFEIKLMTADYLELVDLFYLDGNQFPQPVPATAYDKPALEQADSPRDGVCTDGEAWRGDDIAPGQTRTGTAPQNCHGDIEQ